MFTASPPWMRPRLIDGRSNRGADSPANGSVSMRRKMSTARRTALSPSQGVEPWAAVPGTSRRTSSTPFAWIPTRMSVGSPHTTKSALSPSRTSIWVQFSPGSGTFLVRNDDQLDLRAREACPSEVGRGEHHRRERGLHVVGAAAEEAPAVDAGLELLGVARHHVEMAVEDQPDGPGPDARHQAPAAAGLDALDRRPTSLQPARDEVGGQAMPERREVS